MTAGVNESNDVQQPLMRLLYRITNGLSPFCVFHVRQLGGRRVAADRAVATTGAGPAAQWSPRAPADDAGRYCPHSPLAGRCDVYCLRARRRTRLLAGPRATGVAAVRCAG